MSFDAVRPYFRDKLNTLGFQEWPDGFNFDNIPSNLLDKAYHLGPVSFDAIDLNNIDQTFVAEITTKLFYKGFNDPAGAIDRALTDSKTFVESAMDPSMRLTTSGLCNVRVIAMDQFELDISNDNAVRVEYVWNLDVIIKLT